MDGCPLYEGKGKQLFASDVESELILRFNNPLIKRYDKISCSIACFIFDKLHDAGIHTHFIYREDATGMRVQRADAIPIKVKVRNVISGTICQRLGVQDGKMLSRPLIELYYKSEPLHDPMINEEHANILGYVSSETVSSMRLTALDVNQIMVNLFNTIGLRLIDCTVEFSQSDKGLLVNSDMTDSCHLCDKHERVDFCDIPYINMEIAKRFGVLM